MEQVLSLPNPIRFETSVARPLVEGRPACSRAATTFVAVWIAIGIGFHLEADAYLLAGVPLGLAFQWGIARRPC